MRMTERDHQVLAQLAVCRWLKTSQIKALCFPSASVEVARRRLRKLLGERFIRRWRLSVLSEALFSLTPIGRSFLLSHGWVRELSVPRRPPGHLDHSLAINDLRVVVERVVRSGGYHLSFFFASWELPELSWSHPIIPDALCSLEQGTVQMTLAFEYDRGEESLAYIGQTKLSIYNRGLPGLPISHVIFVTETTERASRLAMYTRQMTSSRLSLFSFITHSQFLAAERLAEIMTPIATGA